MRLLKIGLFLAVMAILFSPQACSQAPSAFPYAKPCTNDTTTGTTQFTLTKINASGNCIIMATTDTTGYSGVCVSNCGKTGTAWLAFTGQVPLTISNASTALHYVQVSGTTAGNGLDSGATTYPTSGGDVIGRVVIGAAGGAAAIVDLNPEIVASASAASVTGGSSRSNWGTGNSWVPAIGGTTTTCATNDILCQSQAPRAGTVANFFVVASNPALASGQNVTFTLFKSTTVGSAGSATAVTCSITGNGTLQNCNDTTHSFTVNQGDTLTVQWSTTSGTPPSISLYVTFTIQ